MPETTPIVNLSILNFPVTPQTRPNITASDIDQYIPIEKKFGVSTDKRMAIIPTKILILYSYT